MNFNSVENQNIKRRFVEREIYGCFTQEIEQLLGAGAQLGGNFPDLSDIENLYAYDWNGELLDDDERKERIEELNEELDSLNDKAAQLSKQGYRESEIDEITEELEHAIEQLESDIEDLGELEQEPKEIFEWWAVSGFLAEKLKAYNEPILEYGRNCYWGRTCTGQLKSLDSPISNICSDMGILEGQENSWAE